MICKMQRLCLLTDLEHWRHLVLRNSVKGWWCKMAWTYNCHLNVSGSFWLASKWDFQHLLNTPMVIQCCQSFQEENPKIFTTSGKYIYWETEVSLGLYCIWQPLSVCCVVIYFDCHLCLLLTVLFNCLINPVNRAVLWNTCNLQFSHLILFRNWVSLKIKSEITFFDIQQ